MNFSLREEILVSGSAWRNSMTSGVEAAALETPLGRMSVVRTRSKRHPYSSPMGGPLEDWIFQLNGDEVARLYALCAPYLRLQRKLRMGIDGTMEGRPIALTVKRSFSSKRRVLRISSNESEAFTEFRPQGLSGTRLISEIGGATGGCSRQTWNVENLNRRTMVAISFYEMGRLRSLLDSPLMEFL